MTVAKSVAEPVEIGSITAARQSGSHSARIAFGVGFQRDNHD